MGITERLQVIATHKEPSNKHVIWLKDNTFRKWDGDGWVDIGGGNGTTDYKALKNKPLINGRVLEGNINLEIKGEKGDTGPKGEQGIQGIQGLNGKNGIGIAKVEQIVYSNEDSGENIVRVTLEDGTFTDITILNGSKGTSDDVDLEMSDISNNAVANSIIKKYVDDTDNALSERINTLEQNREGSMETYVFYFDEELTEEKIEANKSFYEAAISEIPASYVVSSYGVIAIPTMVAGSQDSVIIGITTNDEIADLEARDREYLDVRNLQIELVEDGTFAIYKQFDSRLAKVRMLDEVIAKVDEIPDIVANLPQGEKFYYVHIPFEDAPLDEEQLAENAASCTKWLEAHKNNEPLPILCWSAFPYGNGRMHVYDSSDGLLNFSIRTTLGFGNDESLDNAELVAMLIVDGLLYSTGEVELYKPLEEKGLPTMNSFKTINGQSILGEGDIVIEGGSSIEVDAELSDTSENAVSNKAVTMALAEMDEEINHIEGVLEATIIEDEEVTAAALNELNERVSNAATKEELAAALVDVDGKFQNAKDVIDTSIIDNEEVIAAALNDLNKKVNNVYTKDEINTNFTDVNNTLKSYVDSSIAAAITTALNTGV